MEKVNLTSEFDKAYERFKNMIYNGYTIKEIASTFNTTAYYVIFILCRNDIKDINILNAIKNHYSSYKIDNNKCLVISDTHIGRIRKDESVNDPNFILNNEYALYNAYNYAIKNNIYHVIHAGDLIEGNSNISTYRLEKNFQIKYLNRIYPNINNIKTYLLLGNHDYNLAYYDNIKIDEEFNKLKQLEVIGVNYSYISFCNNLIKISHCCNAADFYKNIDLPYSFELSGHSHRFMFYDEERRIDVPTLSCTYEDNSGIGFIELTDEGNEYLFKFLDKNTNLRNEKILKK